MTAILEQLARGPDPVAAPGEALRAGAVVGHFELRRPIGRGGFGVVWEAVDLDLGRPVAFKAVRAGPRREIHERLLHGEAEAAARLSHPNLVTIHEIGRAEAGPYLVQELLRGETLESRLERGPMALREILDVAADVARGLAHAHAEGVVHRDLKPSNVFLCASGRVAVLDFGLAHAFGRRRVDGGTPAYMAPEQRRGAPEDERTDVFALGVLLHRMLAGALPFPEGDGGRALLSRRPVPPLHLAALPALGALVAEMLAKDPVARPRDGGAVLERLLELRRELPDRPAAGSPPARPGRRPLRRTMGLVVGTAVATAAVGALVAKLHSAPEAPAGRPLRVAVADVENGTGEGDLDALSGLLAAALEQSSHLSVMRRAAMLDAAGRMGLGAPARLDAPLARQVGPAAGVQALLLPAVHRAGEGYAVEIQGVDPTGGRALFTVQERADGRGSVPGLLDRIAARIRVRLHEAEGEVRRSAAPVARTLSADLEASARYFAGLDCYERRTLAGSWRIATSACAGDLRRAVERDPDFAVAWYQLALDLVAAGATEAEGRRALKEAVRLVDRAPPRERALIRALDAEMADRNDDALALYGRSIAEHPDDKRVLFRAGDVHYHADEFGSAIPYFERALALDPTYDFALDHLARALGSLGRREALAGRVRAWSAMAQTPTVLHGLVLAWLWLGEPGKAVEAAERQVAAGGGRAARDDLATARFAAGRLEAAAAALRPPEDAFAAARLAAVQDAMGRRRAAGETLADLARRFPADRGILLFSRAVHLVGDGEAEPVWRDAAALRAAGAAAAANLSVALALLGAADHSAGLATGLERGSVAEEEYRAVAAWKRGEAAEAKARLRALEERVPLPDGLPPPAFLRAELCAATGQDGEVVEAVARYRALPGFGMWHGWARPRSQLLLARARERLGQRAEAREAVDALLGEWSGADPEARLLAEARALRARLGDAVQHPK